MAKVHRVRRLKNYPDEFSFSLVCLFLFILPWREAFPSLGPLSIGRLFGIILLGLIAYRVWASVVSTRWPSESIATTVSRALLSLEQPTLFHVLFAAFIGWGALSLLWTPEIGRGIVVLSRIGLAFVASVIIWEVIDTRHRLELAFVSLLLGGLVLSAFVYYELIQTGIAHREDMMFGFNAAIIGRRLVYCVPVAGYLIARSGDRRYALLAITFGFLAAPAILILTVRQALGTFAISIVIFAAAEAVRRYRDQSQSGVQIPQRTLKIGSAILIGAFALIGAVYSQLASYRLHYLWTFDLSLSGRTTIWNTGLDLYQAHANALLGLGIGSYNTLVGLHSPISPNGTYLWPHSAYVGALVELGLVGLVLLLITVAAGVFAIGQERRDGPMVLSVVSIWALLGIVADVHLDALAWILIVFVMVSSRAMTGRPSLR